MTALGRETLDAAFPRVEPDDQLVPAWCVTPDDTGYIHRFFNSSPIDPTGRYLALTKFPYEDRVPNPGDEAEVVVVDLTTGDRRTVAETAGWDTQMGAHVQWGRDDSELFFNDLETATWEPYGVKLDPGTGERTELEGTVYHVSPDGRFAASPDLLGTRVTQDGYGAVVPDDALPTNDGAPEDDGLYVTDTRSGESELVVSIADVVEAFDLDHSEDGPGSYYGFHVMWGPESDRLMFVVRYLADDAGYWDWIPQLVTVRRDGSDLELAVPSEDWRRGGHHVRWTFDGERVTMNLRLTDDGPLRFVSVDPDGSDRTTLTERLVGSGHPTIHPDGRSLVTDAYLHESVAFDDGSVPLRLVDLESETDRTALRVPSEPDFSGPYNLLRVDPHPAWGPDHRFVVYNGCPGGKRRVFVADFGDVVGV